MFNDGGCSRNCISRDVTAPYQSEQTSRYKGSRQEVVFAMRHSEVSGPSGRNDASNTFRNAGVAVGVELGELDRFAVQFRTSEKRS